MPDQALRKRETKPRVSAQVDHNEAVRLFVVEQLNQQQIADKLGCSRQYISDLLGKRGLSNSSVMGYQAFRMDRAGAYAFLTWQLLGTLTPDQLMKMTPYQRVIAITLLENKIQTQESNGIASDLVGILRRAAEDRMQRLSKYNPSTQSLQANESAVLTGHALDQQSSEPDLVEEMAGPGGGSPLVG